MRHIWTYVTAICDVFTYFLPTFFFSENPKKSRYRAPAAGRNARLLPGQQRDQKDTRNKANKAIRMVFVLRIKTKSHKAQKKYTVLILDWAT